MKIRLAEPIFKTLQGEGTFTGWPSLFVRLTGCNFRCEWANGVRCDTPYSSWNAVTDGILDFEELQKHDNGKTHLVITGGEPLMQPQAVTEIISKWTGPWTIETNGSMPSAIETGSGLLSISPKVNTTENHDFDAYRENVLSLIKMNPRSLAQVKFVANQIEDFQLFEKFVVGFPKDVYIVVMGCGTTKEEIDSRAQWIVDECLKRGWNYSDRMHLRLWGGGKGR